MSPPTCSLKTGHFFYFFWWREFNFLCIFILLCRYFYLNLGGVEYGLLPQTVGVQVKQDRLFRGETKNFLF